MGNFEKILEITSDTKVSLSNEIKETLNKELALGMTRFVCRWGTLSDGFDKLTESQRYYQAIREAYQRANELKRLQANAKMAQADLIDAQSAEALATGESERLRAVAKRELAELSLFELLVSAEDTLRQLDEFNKIRLELQDRVRSDYPLGIEQAELDNWRTVTEYKAAQKQLGISVGPLTHMPLPPDVKAQIGFENNAQELSLWHIIANKERIKIEFDGDVSKFLESSLNLKIEGKT